MSWGQYIDSLMATKTMTCCGIYGLDGVKWESTPGFPISDANVKQIIASISDSGNTNGIKLSVRIEHEVCCLYDGPCGLLGLRWQRDQSANT